MPLFQVAHEMLDSDVPFPELRKGAGDATLRFGIQLTAPALPEFHRLRTVEQDDGRPWLTVGRHGTQYMIEFPGHGGFLYQPESGSITCVPAPGADAGTLRHLFLDQVLPLVLNQRSHTVLHASSVVAPSGGALVFLGKSGAGKSTLAADLSQAGSAFVCDDFLLLRDDADGFRAVPTYPGIRLWESATEHLRWDSGRLESVACYTAKRKVSAGDAGLLSATAAAPIEAIYLVNQDGLEVDNPEISPMQPAEAAMTLICSAFCLDPSDKRRNMLDFERLSRLSQAVPVMHLRYPYDFARLAELREAVLAAPLKR